MDTVTVNDNYGYFVEDYVFEVIQATLCHEKAEGSVCSIILVGNEEIQKINYQYRNVDAITDVISFAFEDNQMILPDSMRVLGDIYICIPRMQEQAILYGHSEKREFSFLIVHGLLHLLGYDHIKPEEEKIMFALQDEILNCLGITR
ncbi:MAG: rRNA maturation RNase YbeY [Bacilli bacterium]|nr:rRNA maturation RNase YbeY [Bacilli bacterium]